MTIEEIFRRIVKAHIALILFCCALPVAAVLAMNASQAPEYVARVRLQVASSPAASSTEAEAVSSRVLALASTPSVVQQALDSTGLKGDAQKLAVENVTAERLGESPVVQLDVSQADPARAAAIATALGGEVADFMNQGDRSHYDAVMADAERELAKATSRRDALTRQLQQARSRRALEAVKVELESTQQTVQQLSQQRLSLLLADTVREPAVLVNGNAPDVEMVPSGLVPRAALGLLLGLLAGLSLAVLVETLRPRVAGVRAVARSLDAPVLGTVTDRPDTLTNAMKVAARRQGVETLVLVGLDDRDEKACRRLLEEMPRGWLSHASGSAELSRELATLERGDAGGESLQEQGAGAGRAGEPRASRPPLQAADVASQQVRFTDMYGVTPSEEPTAGVIVVTGGTVLQRQMDSFDDLRRAVRWPVVGIVEVAQRAARGHKR